MAERRNEGRVGAEGEVQVRRLTAADFDKAVEESNMAVRPWASARHEDGETTVTIHGQAAYGGEAIGGSIVVDNGDAERIGAELDRLIAKYLGRLGEEMRDLAYPERRVNRLRAASAERRRKPAEEDR